MSATIPSGEVGFVVADDTAVRTSGTGYMVIDGPDGAVRFHATDLPKVLEALRFLSTHPRVAS